MGKLPRQPTRPVNSVKCVPKVRVALTEEEKQARKDKLAHNAAERAKRAAEHAETAHAKQSKEPSGPSFEDQLFAVADELLEREDDEDRPECDDKLLALDSAVANTHSLMESAKRAREQDWGAGARAIALQRLEEQQRQEEASRIAIQHAEAKAALEKKKAAKKQATKDKTAATRRRNGTSKPTNTHVAIWDDQDEPEVKTEAPLAPVASLCPVAWRPPSNVTTEDM